MALFKNSVIQNTINTYSGINFTALGGFNYLVDSNTTYYVMDWTANRIIIYNSNWQYLNFKSLYRPAHMITVNNNLYISGDQNVFKTDKYLKIISQYNTSQVYYRGLYFNSSNNKIYVAGQLSQKIDVFDLNLTLVDSISTLNYLPYSVQGYKNYIYVGTFNSSYLLVIENKVIIQTYRVCSGIFLTSIIIDYFGYMAVSCYNDQKVYFYYSSNVSYTGIKNTYAVQPHFISFDSNGHFLLFTKTQIYIYNQ